MTTQDAFDEWMAHDEWQFADREACWKFMFDKGKESMRQQLAACQAENLRLLKLAKNWSSLCSNAAVTSGVCCCGDSMDGHASPMSCGHSPCDSGEYYAYQLSEETDKCLATTPGDQLALREVIAQVLGEVVMQIQPEDSYQDGWFRGKADSYGKVEWLISKLRSGEWAPEVLK